MPRIIVALVMTDGPQFQAECRTEGCTAAAGKPWKGTRSFARPDAAAEAQAHRQFHRAQLTAGTNS